MTNITKKNQTKQQLQTALLKLLEQKPLNTISITELAKAASVSRQAFYRNYEYVDEILAEYTDKLFHDFFLDPVMLKPETDWQQCSLHVFRFIRENSNLLKQLNLNNRSKFWFNSCVTYSATYYEKRLGHKVSNDKLIFLTGGIMALGLSWTNEHPKQSINYLATIINPHSQLILNDQKKLRSIN